MAKPEIMTRAGNRVEYLSAAHGDCMPASSDGGFVLYHEYGAQLRLMTDGRHILNVLCGHVGQYGVEIELTRQEVQRFGAEGDEFIHNLGEDVYDHPQSFQGRVLTKC